MNRGACLKKTLNPASAKNSVQGFSQHFKP